MYCTQHVLSFWYIAVSWSSTKAPCGLKSSDMFFCAYTPEVVGVGHAISSSLLYIVVILLFLVAYYI